MGGNIITSFSNADSQFWQKFFINSAMFHAYDMARFDRLQQLEQGRVWKTTTTTTKITNLVIVRDDGWDLLADEGQAQLGKRVLGPWSREETTVADGGGGEGLQFNMSICEYTFRIPSRLCCTELTSFAIETVNSTFYHACFWECSVLPQLCVSEIYTSALLYIPGPALNEMIFMTTSTLRISPSLAILDYC